MKSLLKKFLFYFATIAVFPLYLLFQLFSLFSNKKNAFPGFSQLISMIPGRVGAYVRRAFYCLTIKKCSPHCSIDFGSFFSTQNIEIGDYVYIGANCIISDSIIDDDVMIGSNVHIISGKMTHNFLEVDIPMRLQGGDVSQIKIGHDTWIGNSTIIMANVGMKCVIGAGSVVTKDIEAYSVAVGNPAKIIKKRS